MFSSLTLNVAGTTGAGGSVTSRTAQVATRLTASAVGTSSAPESVVYVWRRNGVAIPGATKATYTPVLADVAKEITVVAAMHAAGLQRRDHGLLGDHRRTGGHQDQGQKKTTIAITVTVTQGSPAANGKATVTDGAKTLGTVTVRNGRGTLAVKALKHGTHKLSATFTGTGYATSTTSWPVEAK